MQQRGTKRAKCKAENESFHADKSVLAERVRGLEDKVKATKATTNICNAKMLVRKKRCYLSPGVVFKCSCIFRAN